MGCACHRLESFRRFVPRALSLVIGPERAACEAWGFVFLEVDYLRLEAQTQLSFLCQSGRNQEDLFSAKAVGSIEPESASVARSQPLVRPLI